MNYKAFLFRAVALLVFLAIFGSTFAQTAPCQSQDHVRITLVLGGATICVPEREAVQWIADGSAVLTQNLTVNPEVPLAVENTIELEKCEPGHVKVVIISGEESFCLTRYAAERLIAGKFAVEVDEEDGLTTISAPEIFPERLCTENQIRMILTSNEKVVCASRAIAQRWVSLGLATEADFGNSASRSCGSAQVPATVIRTGKQVCASESTVSAWEEQGVAIRTSAITVLPEKELVARNAIPLKECEEAHVKVNMVSGIPAFCVKRSVGQRWIQEELAFEVDEDKDELTTISVPDLLPERLCKASHIKVSIADTEEIICTLAGIAQVWLDDGFFANK